MRPLPEDPLGILEQVARKSITEIDSSRPWARAIPFLRGIFIHTRFTNYVRRLGPQFAAEESYLNGRRVTYGTAGSARADAIFGPRDYPTFAVELKTSGAFMTTGEFDHYEANLPWGTPIYVIQERTLVTPRYPRPRE